MRAVVLSAGYGTRLGELTREMPKPLLPVAGRPLVEQVIGNIARAGVTEVAVNLHFKAELVREELGDGSVLGVRITYTHEPELLGTAGTLASLRDFIGGETLIAHYADVLTDEDFAAMASFHAERRALTTVLVHERAGSNSVVVLDDEQRIVEFAERPAEDDPVRGRSSWVNSGVWICEPALLELIPAPPADLARDILPLLAGRPDVYAYPLTGFRIAVDSRDRYRQARRRMGEP